MSWRVAVCEDDSGQAARLQAQVEEWAADRRTRCAVERYESAEALLFARGETDPCDILLLDVEMKGMSGVELAKRLRAKGCRAEIVFVTSHSEFVGEGYEVDALHYLVKPVAARKLWQVLSRAAERLAVEPPHVIVRLGGETVRLYESEILCVEACLHELAIRTRDGQYRVRERLTDLEGRLSEDFFRAHRSYLVNLKAVARIGRASVTLEGGLEIPLARGKYDQINRAFIARN